MTINMKSTEMSDLVQIISEQGMAELGSAFQVLLNQAMLIERDRYLGAASYERTETRIGYANGWYRPPIIPPNFKKNNLLSCL